MPVGIRFRPLSFLTIGEVPGTMYGLSESGWIDSEIFDFWFTSILLAYALPTRPLLLLMDGHSGNFSPLFVNRAAEEQVIVFCLPPHSMHKTQPLDKGVFEPIKRELGERNVMPTWSIIQGKLLPGIRFHPCLDELGCEQ